MSNKPPKLLSFRSNNYITDILWVIFWLLWIVVGTIWLLGNINNFNVSREELHQSQMDSFIEQTGADTAVHSGRLSASSAVMLWVANYSEKPSVAYACVPNDDELVCTVYKP